LVRLSSWMPFAKAAGAAYEQIQVEEVERIEKEMPVAEKGADKIQISADGAMVPLLHGVWAEVRTLVIGEVQPAVEKKGEKVVCTRNLSYFSRKVSAQEFQRLALVEMHRRGVEHAEEVAAIMDGADWEQGFTDYHCPRATRILDFPHAAEHVNGIGEFLHGEHTPESQAWLKERLHKLKHEGPDELLLEFRALQQRHPDSKAICGNLAYLEKRKQQMQYPRFQAQGWPIGSGIVESGNKLVVEARLKGAGIGQNGMSILCWPCVTLFALIVGRKSGPGSKPDCVNKPDNDELVYVSRGSRLPKPLHPARCQTWMPGSCKL